MRYPEIIKKIATNSKLTNFERGDNLIKEMNRLETDILDYRYVIDHYNGDGTAIEDKKRQVKNTLAVVKSDLDVYIEALGITDLVIDKSNKRLGKIVDRIESV